MYPAPGVARGRNYRMQLRFNNFRYVEDRARQPITSQFSLLREIVQFRIKNRMNFDETNCCVTGTILSYRIYFNVIINGLILVTPSGFPHTILELYSGQLEIFFVGICQRTPDGSTV